MKKTVIRKRSQFPKYLQPFKQLKGICIGQCIDKNDSIKKEHIAHGHGDVNDKYRGWICLRYKYVLKVKLLMLHEMAHVIANTSGSIPPHGKAWKDTVIKIGGTFKEFFFKANGNTYKNTDYTYRNSMR